MSAGVHDPVELLRTFVETMDRNWDFEALAGFFSPDAEWDMSELGLPDCDGVAAIGDFLVHYWATWEDHHHEIEEILNFGNGVLFVVIWEDGCQMAVPPACKRDTVTCGSGCRARSFELRAISTSTRPVLLPSGPPSRGSRRCHGSPRPPTWSSLCAEALRPRIAVT